MRYQRTCALVAFFFILICNSIYSFAQQIDTLIDIQTRATDLSKKDFHDNDIAGLNDNGELKGKIEKLKKCLQQLANEKLKDENLKKALNDFPNFSRKERKILDSIDSDITKKTTELKNEIGIYRNSIQTNIKQSEAAKLPIGDTQNNLLISGGQDAHNTSSIDKEKDIMSLGDSIRKLNDTIMARDIVIGKLTVGKEDKTDGFYILNVIIASILLVAIIWLLYNRMMIVKTNVRLKADFENLNDKWREKYEDMQLDSLVNSPLAPQQFTVSTMPTHINSTGNNKPRISASTSEVMYFENNIPSKGKYFFGEAMVTAGPRKNFTVDAKEGDYGLGEDAAGLIIQHDKAFFWILDGTSDADSLSKPLMTASGKEEEYFSSRLLAQSISWHIQAMINKPLPGMFNAETILRTAISETEKDWRANIDQLNEESKEALLAILAKKNVLQCSTTAIFGILTLKGTLDVCRVGDSKIVAYPGNYDFAQSTGRQFANIQQQGKNIALSFNSLDDARKQNIHLDNVKTILAMTDGVSNQMENWLKNFDSIDFSNRTTRETFAHFKQNTYDDKALCILQIRG